MKTICLTAVLALGLGLASQAAYAQDGAHLNDPAQWQREHNRAMARGDWANDPYNSRSSDDLNRQELMKAQAAGGPYPDDNAYDSQSAPPAQPMASSGTDYSSDQTYSNDQGYVPPPPPYDTTVTVVGPPHDANESSPEPNTNPQSSGTPMTDTPYVDRGQYVPPDEDSSGMYQPPAK